MRRTDGQTPTDARDVTEPGSPEQVGIEQPAATPGSNLRIVAAASLIVTIGAIASRVLGWVRLAVIGAQFGAGRELDAYFAAFRIPDAIFQLVVAGTLFTALLPVFVSYRARHDEVEAWKVASSVINLVLIALAALSLVMAIFAPLFVPIVAPGFDAPTTELTVRMTRLMLLSPVFLGLGAVVSGILNGYDRFAVPSLAPLVYNLAIIAAAIFVAPILGVEALAVGVAVGALGHLLVQLPALMRVGSRYDLRIHLHHPGVRQVTRLMVPRAVGLAATQANFVVSTILASGLPGGSITAYNYGFQLSQVPVGIVGVSIAVALFPTLSRSAALGQVAEVRSQVANSLRVMFFLSAPITAIMVALREPVTAVFFQYGAFSSESTRETAGALLFFSLAIFAHNQVQVLARAFYALHDSRTPVIWAVVAVVVNLLVMAWLVGPMGVDGLALAMSLSAVIEVIGLIWALQRRIDSIEGRSILRSAGLSTVAGLMAGLLMLGGLEVTRGLAPVLLQNGFLRILALLGLSSAGIATFIVAAAAFRIPELAQMRDLAARRLRRRPAA